jgi:hypothetical protein
MKDRGFMLPSTDESCRPSFACLNETLQQWRHIVIGTVCERDRKSSALVSIIACFVSSLFIPAF